MQHLDQKSLEKLNQRIANQSLRALGVSNELIDFSSNDYIGFSTNKAIYNNTLQLLESHQLKENGATGSRLISGNHSLYDLTENYMANFHSVEKALIHNSGYSANVGLIATVTQRNDIIFYDELCHASIREGISVSHAKAYKFKHNNLQDLKDKLQTVAKNTTVYIITESVFSMDGDSPDIDGLIQLSKTYKARLILDEAHALGVFGVQGSGFISSKNLEAVFARVITFGKGLGCHGAAILGSETLIQFLVNFSKPFIYTTGLPPHAVATIYSAYQELNKTSEVKKLQDVISFFNSEVERLDIQSHVLKSESAIQCVIIKGNENVKRVAKALQLKKFNIKAILSPTVPKNQERLRFCLHSYNTKTEITTVLEALKTELNHGK